MIYIQYANTTLCTEFAEPGSDGYHAARELALLVLSYRRQEQARLLAAEDARNEHLVEHHQEALAGVEDLIRNNPNALHILAEEGDPLGVAAAAT